MTDRKALHAYVIDGAHDQWHEFAAEHGVSVSAMLEALAPELDHIAETNGTAELITTARKIDAKRRRRTK